MEELARAAGFEVVPWDRRADVRVFNSCTVTAKSDRECRHEVRRAKRRDPECVLILTGCYAQVSPGTAATVAGVDLVLGNPDKHDLVAHARRLLAQKQSRSADPAAGVANEGTAEVCVSAFDEDPCFPTALIHHFSGYTRAFLEVQTGCDARCSYCIIPRARGSACSMRLADVLEQLRILGARGYREVVLTGIHLGMWGRDTGEGTLADLLTGVIRELPDGPRLRLSSTEPMEFDDRVIAVVKAAGHRVAHHFHVPLQSGSDVVLRRMNRPYRALDYLERVTALRNAFPDAAIGADVIVGFPSETEDDFAASLRLVEASPLTYVHVFAYSDRPGTASSLMEPKVPPETIAARSAALRELGSRKRREFLQRFAGQEIEALVLGRRTRDGRLEALSGNYMQVYFDGPDELMNTYVRLVLEKLGADDTWSGRLVTSAPYPEG